YARSTRSDTFVLGTDLNLYHSQDSTANWNSWGAPSSTSLYSAPAATSHDPNFIDVFVTSTAGDIWHVATQDGGTTIFPWGNWGHPFISPNTYSFVGRPTVTSWGASRLDIYARARVTPGQGPLSLFHRSWDAGSDSGWQLVSTPGFTISSPPGASSWAPHHVELAVVDTAGNLWEGFSPDGASFTSWVNLGAGSPYPAFDINAAPDIGSHDLNTYDIYLTDVSGGLQHFSYVNGSRAPHDRPFPSAGVKAGTGPTVVGLGDQRFMLSYTSGSGAVWQATYDFGFNSWLGILSNGRSLVDADVSAW
ncbi:MAG: hypothetical protein ACRELY_06730, partial [Polyangiaceae bacterium]